MQETLKKTLVKKAYDKPRMIVEEFQPQVYVAACDLTNTILQATPICAISGESAYHVRDTQTYNDAGKIIGSVNPYGDNASGVGRTHGSCAKTTGMINLSTGSTGTEPNGQSIYNLVIGDKIIGEVGSAYVTNNVGTPIKWSRLEANSAYKATWKSSDGTYTYDHYGVLEVKGYTNRHFS